MNRIVAIIKSDPHKERLDRVITRWLKRHLQRLDAAVDSKQLNSLVEDSAMLAENLQHWAEQERMLGREEGREEVRKEARQESKKKDQEVALKLIALDSMTDDQIADISGLNLEDIAALRKNNTH